MFKRFFLFLLVGGSLGLIGFTLFNARGPERLTDRSLLLPIPSNAAVVIETDDLSGLWRRLAGGNVLWDGLNGIDVFEDWRRAGASFDSTLFAQNSAAARYVDGSRALRSLHPSANGGMNSLTVMALRTRPSMAQLGDFITTNFSPDASFSELDHQGRAIYADKVNGTCFTVSEGLLILSSNQVLLETAIRTMASGGGLLENADFNKVARTAGNNASVRMYVDHESLPTLMGNYRKRPKASPLSEHFASWGEFDMKLKSNALAMNGMVIASDSTHAYLSVLTDQEPVDMDVLELLPTTTAECVIMSLTDKDSYAGRYADYAEETGMSRSEGRLRDGLMERHGITTDLLMESIGDRVTFGDLEVKKGDARAAFVIMPLLDGAELMTDSVMRTMDNYRGMEVWRLRAPELMRATFGRHCPEMNEALATVIDGHLLITSDARTLHTFIDFNLSGRTLGDDETFSLFANELARESVLTYMLMPSRAVDNLRGEASDSFSKDLDEHRDILRQYQGMCVQYEPAKGDLFYQNLYLNHNPVYKKETASVWETALDTTFSTALWATKNHRNGQYEVLVASDVDRLTLLSASGKKLWTRDLMSPILSEVTQVDMYKNNKLQYLFNTADRIYLIDRLGRDVEGYPIELPAKASGPVKVMDYDSNKRYRVLVATDDGMLNNYDIEGKPVKGWAYEKGKFPLIGDIRHFTINGKDYISTIDASGDLKYLDRSGKVRHDARQDMTDYAGGKYLIRTGKDIGSTRISYFTNEGDFWSMTSDGDDRKRDVELEAGEQLTWNRAAERFILRTDVIEIEGTGVSEERTIELKEDCDHLQVYSNNAGTWLLAGASRTENVYLYTQDGELISGFPIRGGTDALLWDMDGDGHSDLVIGDRDGVVYMYALSL